MNSHLRQHGKSAVMHEMCSLVLVICNASSSTDDQQCCMQHTSAEQERLHYNDHLFVTLLTK